MLVAQSENTFKNGQGQALIEINKKNRSLNIISKADTVPYSKVENAFVNKEDLVDYTGKYFSTETNSTMIIFRKMENFC